MFILCINLRVIRFLLKKFNAEKCEIFVQKTA